jgi:hypothetical protein
LQNFAPRRPFHNVAGIHDAPRCIVESGFDPHAGWEYSKFMIARAFGLLMLMRPEPRLSEFTACSYT